ncbi:branched-chain amino acid ABC transporter ATP-binding protein/permease [Castellaniella sp. GW247-6E4]|uniref:branched-chain amino acid ABC transporter ATP-binding protein/permease n=1 Tax=Castellaniella sp. GW247-6E4 TaxID=3140380 RepID=UPI00331505A8
MTRSTILLSCGALLLIGASPLWMSDDLLRFTTTLLIYALAAIGLDLMYGIAGLLSLGHAVFFGIGTYVTGLLLVKGDSGILFAVLGGVLSATIGGIAAFTIGAIGLLRRAQYFTIVTLAAVGIVFSVINGSAWTGGPSGLTGIRKGFGVNSAIMDLWLFYLSLILVFLFILLIRNFKNASHGRALRLAKTLEAAAHSYGFSVYGNRLRAVVLGGAIAGLAGSLFALSLGAASPEFAGLTQSIDLLLMVIIGGAGSIWGVIPGVLIVRGLPEFVQAVRDWQVLILGLLMLLVLIRFPLGIAGTLEHYWKQRARLKAEATKLSRHGGADLDAAQGAPAIDHHPSGSAPLAPASRIQGENSPLLALEHTGKKFGGIQALHDVSITVQKGSLHALIGPNGAGKSTLLNCITGMFRPTTGTIMFKGVDISALSAEARAEMGMSRTFQLLELAPELTITENVKLGAYRRQRNRFLSSLALGVHSREEVELERETARVLAQYGLSEIAQDLPKTVAVGLQRLSGVARCVLSGADLILLDEPAAGLNPVETAVLGKRLRELVSTDTTIILIEHDMKLIMDIADVISVLVNGSHLRTGGPAAIREDKEVIAAYLGSELED